MEIELIGSLAKGDEMFSYERQKGIHIITNSDGKETKIDYGNDQSIAAKKSEDKKAEQLAKDKVFIAEHIFNIHVVNLHKTFLYKGELKNGKPHGIGLLVNKKEYQNNKFKGFDKLKSYQIGFFEEGTLKYGKLKEESKISIGEFKMVIGPHVPLLELVNGVERNDEMRTSLY